MVAGSKQKQPKNSAEVMQLDSIKVLSKEQRERIVNFLTVELPKTKFFQPDGKPNKGWKLLYGNDWDSPFALAADLSGGEYMFGERQARLYALVRDAAAPFEGPRDKAAEDASGEADRIVQALTKRAGKNVAEFAGAYAGLVALDMATEDLNYKGKEEAKEAIKARWEVWQKGYSLLGEVDGVLYVYSTIGRLLGKNAEMLRKPS